ncbi:hypothetical protein SLH46_19345 [Draconibacterium sp. IB214405]|uniref:hypothetical protein n=1 Tax=Draconibacterium sp. IB214405 TaxID=3097352 RepID=UPI002A10A737|nr:hypothetical protein [Draconibacterium sp. IB214405]MDX8341363.1 hypothetical protein [Draconibacterium sp. IB214405]
MSILFSLVSNFNDKENGVKPEAYPLYAGKVQLSSSSLKDDSTKLVSDVAGNPLFYSREVLTEACETGVCYPIQLTLFWDYAGSFLGFSVPAEFPLTKDGHKEFSELDYFLLFTLLNHPDSKISKFTKRDLVKVNQKKQDESDAVSGATIKVSNETLVSGAAFTCLSLWNIVNKNTENLDPKNFERTTSVSISTEDLDSKLSSLKNLSVGELALLLQQAQNEKLLRKFEIQMQLVNQLEGLPALQSLIISNYLNREKYLYPEANEVLKKDKKIAACFLGMTHFGS